MKPEHIPQELRDILDKDAGKKHSTHGPVLATLAKILTRHSEMLVPPTTCGCPYRWGSYGKLYGISMREGWIRVSTHPKCKEHDPKRPLQPPGHEQINPDTP